MCFAMRLFTSVKRENECFASSLDEVDEEPFPLDLENVAHEQQKDKGLHAKCKKDKQKYKTEVRQDVKLITYEGRVYIPPCLRDNVLNWYHHYLQHPGANRMYNTIKQTVYWPGLQLQCERLCARCKACQLSKKLKQKYGMIPPKDEDLAPWHTVCVDCMAPFTIKVKEKGRILAKRTVRALTMIDPATGWIEIAHVPENDFNAARISQLFNQYWLSRYPRPVKCVCDNGNEFKFQFKHLVKGFGIKYRLTTVKNPQANGIVERVHGVLNDMIRTQDLDNHEFDPVDPWGDILAELAWAVRSLYHRTLDATPGQLVFGRDMLFDMLFTPDWNEIRARKRAQVLKDNERENSKRRQFTYKIGDKVLLKRDHLRILRKSERRNKGPYTIVQVNKNGTLSITNEDSGTTSTVNIRCLIPFCE